MRIIGAIVAMTQTRVIGVHNAMPWHYPADLKRFKQLTLNSTVIMGRKTWQSIGSRPLPKRRNIVISHQGVDGVECYRSIESALGAVTAADNSADNAAIWFIGGGEIYRGALAYCNLLDITMVPDNTASDGAITFPSIDSQHWIAGEQCVFSADSRLKHQRFIRRCDANNVAALALLARA